MGFVAPSLLLALAAALGPWLIHRIGKRNIVPVRFAAMQLLLRAQKRILARQRIREVLLLLARTAIAAALPLIFARPFTETTDDTPEAALNPQSAVIILDDSASLRRAAGLQTLFERAKDRARALVERFPSDSDLALLLASAGSNAPVAELTAERKRLFDALADVTCSARVADFTEAMRRASSILNASPRSERRIFLVTDLQASGWDAQSSLTGRGAPDVVVLDVTGERTWDNRAVTKIAAEPADEAGTGGVAVTAEISSFSRTRVSALPVTLKIDGTIIAKNLVDLPAGGKVTRRFVHALPADGAAAHEVEVEIEADQFTLDDRRATRIELYRALRVLIVNGDTRTVRTEDEAFFLEAALRAGDSSISVSSVLPEDLPLDGLGKYNVIFAANVAAPAAPLAAALAKFVRAGGGLFISVGAQVNATAWNEQLGALLPQPLGLARTASALPGQAEGETIDVRPAERLAPLDRHHPLLASFADGWQGLASAKFFKFMLLEPVPDTIERSVVLRFESGSPALVEREVGRGRVLLLATTIDREWTDLPIRSGFLPLMKEAARHLAGTPSDAGSSSLLVGQARSISFLTIDRRLEVVKPSGAVWSARRERPGDDKTVLFLETDEPGFYRVRSVGPGGALQARPADGFVVNINTHESDTARLGSDRRPDRHGPKPATGTAPPKRRVELWHLLALVLVAAVLLESLLTVRWRRPPAVERQA